MNLLKGFWQETALAIIVILVLTGGFYAAYSRTMRDFTVMHENVHVAINQKFGANSTVNISHSWSNGVLPYRGETQNATPYNLTAAQWNDLRSLHLQNEIQGYNTTGIMKAIFFSAWLLTISLAFVLIISRSSGVPSEK